MSETLLQTKLYIPVTRNSLVPRIQLLTRLNIGLNGRLTLISAPAGFGKTTLIVHWSKALAESSTWRLAWFSLDDNDNDVSRFFTYFITALQKIDAQIGQTALELLHAPQASNIQISLTELLNNLAQSSQAIALALDDYHLITNPEIHKGITFLLENAPPHFHLLLLSRADPPFSLARLRARHQMTEIRQQDLRFEQSETAVFLNQLMALDLPATAVAALEKRTEGWVAGLQMAALSLQGQTDTESYIQRFTSSNRFIFDYLAEEVLARRPEGTRDFLLQTAVLDKLCAPLCDAVLNIPEAADSQSQQILEQLESANLFLIPLDDNRHWYRYHHLFADLLQQQARRENPELEKAAHERASHWFEKAGYAEEAIQHALSATNYERAANLVTQYGEKWLWQGEIGKILLWTERLPTSWQHQNPRLTLNYAWALLFRGHARKVETAVAQLPPTFADTSPDAIDLLVLQSTLAIGQNHIAQAITLSEKVRTKLEALEPKASNLTMRGLAVINQGYINHIQGNHTLAIQNYDLAVSLNREAGNLLTAIYATQGWGSLLIEQGQLPQAETVLLDGLQIEREWAKKLGTGDRKLVAATPLHISLAQLYYQWNRLAEAEAQLIDGDKLLISSDPFDTCTGLMALVKLRLAQDKTEAIPPILTQLQEIEQRATALRVRRQLAVALATIRCALYSQQPPSELRTAIERALPELESDSLTQARALITLGRPHEAVPLLEKLTAQTEADGRYGLWLSAAVLLCLAYQSTDEKTTALTWLSRAVQTAAPLGHIRLFLDEGQPLQHLLQELVQQKNAPTYATTLLAYFPTTPQPIVPPPVNNPLSPREREVLQLIAEGLTNQEIATQLVIAPSTAKRHVINIYNKLDIKNRAEATARAYELGIVTVE